MNLTKSDGDRSRLGKFRLAPLLALVVGIALAGGGCDPCSTCPTGVPPQALIATASSLFAVDPARGLAYLALDSLSETTGDGQVEVINVNADPDVTDPRVATIDLGHPDYPGGIAIDPSAGIVIVTSGQNGNGGFLDLIDENTNTVISGSPYPFPPGADSGIKPDGAPGQVLFDPLTNHAVVSTIDAATCPSAGQCTGFAEFDLGSKTFGGVYQTPLADHFAFDATLDQIIAPADDIDPGIGSGAGIIAVDVPNSAGCILSDQNVSELDSDPDAAGIDPVTNIVVLGNYFSSQATVINLQGSSFDETVSPCMLNEGGTPPNSVNIDTGTGTDMPGVAVNPISHEAFLTANDDSPIALLGLPAVPATQLDPASVTALAHSTIPDDPDGVTFGAEAFPYGTVIDVVNNQGYVLESNFTYLVRIDLNTLKTDPTAISTPLASGQCAGTTSSFSCKNGNGVEFFPITPSASVPSATALWVPNGGGNSIDAYSLPQLAVGGNIAPSVDLSGSNTQLSDPSGLCFDQSGNLWVVNFVGSKQPSSIAEFAAASLASGGNIPPSATISGTNTTLVGSVTCDFDSAGNLWVVNDDNFSQSLAEFTPAQLATGGNIAPAITLGGIFGTTDGLCNSDGLVFDSSGDLWASGLCFNNVAAFTPTQLANGGNVAPQSELIGGNTTINQPVAVTFDAAGNLWVANSAANGGAPGALEFSASGLAAGGNIPPAVTIAGNATLMNNPAGVAFDPSGNLWVAQQGSNSLTRYSTADLAAGGNVAPSSVVSGANTMLQLNLPVAMKFH